MEHDVEMSEDSALIRLRGDIDLSCSDKLRKLLLDVVIQTPLTIVELSGVSGIDSSGITSLLDGEQTAKRRGHKFELIAPGDKVMRVLKLAQLDRVFTIR